MDDPPGTPAELEQTLQLVELIESTLPDVTVLAYDHDLRMIAAAGPAFARHGLGGARETAGRRLDDILPTFSWSRMAEHHQAVVEGETRSVRYASHDGQRVYALHMSPTAAGGVTIAQDVTPWVGQDEGLAAARARQESLVRIATGVINGTTLECQVAAVISGVSEALDAELVAVFERGPDAVRLVGGAGWERDLARLAVDVNDLWHVQHTLDAGEPTIVCDVREEPRFTDRLLLANGAISGVALPVDGTRVLSVFRRRDQPLDADERAFAERVACLTAVALARRAADDAALHAALHDPLTGLPARNLLLDRLEGALRDARRYGGSPAVVFIDLNGFKRINDTLGHHAGDEVLRAVAERLRSCVRDTDTVARYGGDEFVIVAERLADDAEAGELARRAAMAFRWPFLAGGRQHEVGAAVGLAVADGEADARALLRRADAEMYRSKLRP